MAALEHTYTISILGSIAKFNGGAIGGVKVDRNDHSPLCGDAE
jgi:hypothetical protein